MTLQLIDEAVAAGARQERACEVLGLSPRTLQRWREPDGGEDRRQGPIRPPANKLSDPERARILQLVNSLEFRDLSPLQIVPLLADRKIYVASEATVYRLLRQQGQLSHRQRSRPKSARRPREHAANGPGQVWSWDITYLRSPVRGMFFYLYLILDVWSRKIVGAQVFEEENSEHATELFLATCAAEGLDPKKLVFHSDNGSPMKGATLLATLELLGTTASFSRPRVSNDNPYSEALFRTLKYRPEYPDLPFASVAAAQLWVDGFVRWYNTEHRHSALRFVTPEDRHTGREPALLENRHKVYEEARRRHPQRWAGETRNWKPVGTVYLNPERPREGKAGVKKSA